MLSESIRIPKQRQPPRLPCCPDIDSFEAMMAREECAKGFLVSFDYTGDALTDISRFFKLTGKVFVALTVGENPRRTDRPQAGLSAR